MMVPTWNRVLLGDWVNSEEDMFVNRMYDDQSGAGIWCCLCDKWSDPCSGHQDGRCHRNKKYYWDILRQRGGDTMMQVPAGCWKMIPHGQPPTPIGFGLAQATFANPASQQGTTPQQATSANPMAAVWLQSASQWGMTSQQPPPPPPPQQPRQGDIRRLPAPIPGPPGLAGDPLQHPATAILTGQPGVHPYIQNQQQQQLLALPGPSPVNLIANVVHQQQANTTPKKSWMEFIIPPAPKKATTCTQTTGSTIYSRLTHIPTELTPTTITPQYGLRPKSLQEHPVDRFGVGAGLPPAAAAGGAAGVPTATVARYEHNGEQFVMV